MAPKADVRTRAPRGTKTVTQAFFAALDEIPDGQQAVVGAAALAGIRDELKERRAKNKGTATKARTRSPAKQTAAAKAPPARGARKAATSRRAAAPAGKPVAAKRAPAKRTVASRSTKPKRSGKPVAPPTETAPE